MSESKYNNDSSPSAKEGQVGIEESAVVPSPTSATSETSSLEDFNNAAVVGDIAVEVTEENKLTDTDEATQVPVVIDYPENTQISSAAGAEKVEESADDSSSSARSGIVSSSTSDMETAEITSNSTIVDIHDDEAMPPETIFQEPEVATTEPHQHDPVIIAVAPAATAETEEITTSTVVLPPSTRIVDGTPNNTENDTSCAAPEDPTAATTITNPMVAEEKWVKRGDEWVKETVLSPAAVVETKTKQINAFNEKMKRKEEETYVKYNGKWVKASEVPKQDAFAVATSTYSLPPPSASVQATSASTLAPSTSATPAATIQGGKERKVWPYIILKETEGVNDKVSASPFTHSHDLELPQFTNSKNQQLTLESLVSFIGEKIIYSFVSVIVVCSNPDVANPNSEQKYGCLLCIVPFDRMTYMESSYIDRYSWENMLSYTGRTPGIGINKLYAEYVALKQQLEAKNIYSLVKENDTSNSAASSVNVPANGDFMMIQAYFPVAISGELTTMQMKSRAALLSRWMGVLLSKFHRYEPDVQELILTFLGINTNINHFGNIIKAMLRRKFIPPMVGNVVQVELVATAQEKKKSCCSIQ